TATRSRSRTTSTSRTSTNRRSTTGWRRQPASRVPHVRRPTRSSTSTSRRRRLRSRPGTSTTSATSSRSAWAASCTSPCTSWTSPRSASASSSAPCPPPPLRGRRAQPDVEADEERGERQRGACDRDDERRLPKRARAVVARPVRNDVEADAVGDRLAGAVADEDAEEDRLHLLRRGAPDRERRVLALRDAPARPGERLTRARLRPAGLRLRVVELEVGRDAERDVVDADRVALVRHGEGERDVRAHDDACGIDGEVGRGGRGEGERRGGATAPGDAR